MITKRLKTKNGEENFSTFLQTYTKLIEKQLSSNNFEFNENSMIKLKKGESLSAGFKNTQSLSILPGNLIFFLNIEFF